VLMSEEIEVTDEDKWPAVHQAYDFVLPSYQGLLGRVEAAGTRAQAIMTFASSVTLGFPLLQRAINEKALFTTPAVLVALAFFVSLMVIGIVARESDRIKLVNPARLYGDSLYLSPWEFKRDAIYYAGQCFDHNRRLVDRKALLCRLMSYLLIGEILALLMWTAGN